jgi:hypothetical protein
MLFVFTLLLATPPADLKTQGEPGLRTIRGEALSAHIRFLADDPGDRDREQLARGGGDQVSSSDAAEMMRRP